MGGCRVSLTGSIFVVWLATACTSNVPEPQAALPPTAPLPSTAEELLRKYNLEDEACRGGRGDNPATDEACNRREHVGDQLRAEGWCFGENAAYGYQMEWRRCGDPRFATPEGAMAAANADLEEHLGDPAPASTVRSPGANTAWYVVAAKLGDCVLLTEAFGVETPEDVAARFAQAGEPQDLLRKSDVVIMRKNAADPGIAFVRGDSACREALAAVAVLGLSGP